MKTVLESSLEAELVDLLKQLGKLNAMSLELQFLGYNLIEYRYCLNKCIDLADESANSLNLYKRNYKTLTQRNLSLTNTLLTIHDLRTYTSTVAQRFEDVYLAYERENLKLLKYFLNKLCITITDKRG